MCWLARPCARPGDCCDQAAARKNLDKDWEEILAVSTANVAREIALATRARLHGGPAAW
jgi:hypothetical protein